MSVWLRLSSASSMVGLAFSATASMVAKGRPWLHACDLSEKER